jgi:hypothetical protein
MFSISLKLKRPLVGVAVAAGLLVAAGPASASPSAPLIAPPQPTGSFTLVLDGFDCGVVTRDAGSRLPTPKTVTDELFGNYNF